MPTAVTSQEVLPYRDLVAQILTNGEALYPREQDLKVVSGLTGGAFHYGALLARDSKSASVHKDFKVVLQGPAENTRSTAMSKLLQEIERKIAKEIMKK